MPFAGRLLISDSTPETRMPGQINDLQQWLDALKQKAEQERGRHQTHVRPEATTSPVQAQQPVQTVKPVRPVQTVKPVQPVRPVEPVQKTAGGFLADMLQEALDLPSQAELQKRAEEAANREKALRRKQQSQQRKQAQARKRKQVEAQARKRAEAEKRKQEELLARKQQRMLARSALGLSGNLIRDLRHNPQALREAVLLVEILGPPLAERDPFERIV